MITYDRTSRGISGEFFRYWKQDGVSFCEISADRFPKEVATQNMEFSKRYYAVDGGTVDMIAVNRELDPSDKFFRSTLNLTACVWNELATGESLGDSRKHSEIRREVLDEYMRKYAPVRLSIIKQDSEPHEPTKGQQKTPQGDAEDVTSSLRSDEGEATKGSR